MSRKKKDDVLHIPPEAVPTAPDRSAGTEERAPHRGPPHLQPDGGPGSNPGSGGNPRIIEPVGTPYSPGVSVN